MSYPLRVYLGLNLNRPRGQGMLIGRHGSPSLWMVILPLTRSDLRSNMNSDAKCPMFWTRSLQIPNCCMLLFVFICLLRDFFFFFYVDQLYNVAEAWVICFSTFFISTVSCMLVLSYGAITNRQSSNIEYSIKIKIRISGYQIIRKRTPVDGCLNLFTAPLIHFVITSYDIACAHSKQLSKCGWKSVLTAC